LIQRKTETRKVDFGFLLGVSGFEPEAEQALLEADAPTRSALRANRSGMATKRPRVRFDLK